MHCIVRCRRMLAMRSTACFSPRTPSMAPWQVLQPFPSSLFCVSLLFVFLSLTLDKKEIDCKLVHLFFLGYTAFSVGLLNNRVVYIPIPRLVATSPRIMDPYGRTWERVLAMTRQPQTECAFDIATVHTCARTVI